MRFISSIVGMVFALFGTLGSFMWAGGNPALLLHIAEYLCLGFITMAVVILSCGVKGIGAIFSAFSVYFCNECKLSDFQKKAIRVAIRGSYAAMTWGVFAGFVNILGYANPNPEWIKMDLGATLSIIPIAIILAEILLRPMLNTQE